MTSEASTPNEVSARRLWKGIKKEHSHFYSQIVIIVIVIGFSLYNLTVNEEKKELWVSLLSSCVGYLLPNPKI